MVKVKTRSSRANPKESKQEYKAKVKQSQGSDLVHDLRQDFVLFVCVWGGGVVVVVVILIYRTVSQQR